MPNLPVLLGLGGYLLLTLFIGLWAGRRVASGEDFVVAGRRLPLSLATATLFATWFGGGTCVGAAGAAYTEGLLGVIADPFGAALCLFLSGLFYARILRRMRLLTICDFFRIRFGPSAELISAVLQIPPFLGWAGAQFVAFGRISESLTGADTTVGILIGAGVVLVYTYHGGMWAVSVTDALQGAVLIVGLLWLVPGAISAVGGWGEFAAALPDEKLTMTPEASPLAWAWYLQAWLVVGLGSIPSQDLLQRSLSARDESTAQNASYLAGLLYLTIGLAPVALGLAASLLLPGLDDPELALPEIGRLLLGPLGLGVFVGALLSAIMSSADSALLAPTSVFSENIVRRLKPAVSDAALLGILRRTLVVFVAISLGFALWFQNVYELMLASMEAGVAALIAPFTFGIYWREANAWACNAAMVTGAGTWAVLTAADSAYPADLIGMAVSAVTLVVVTLATRRLIPPLPLRDVEGRPISLAGAVGLGRDGRET